MGYAIKGKYIVSYHHKTPTIIEDGMILVDNDTITAVGHNLEPEDREIINLQHHVVMPGLINAHNHAAMTLFRGYADDVSLTTWLNDYIWPLEAKLTREQVETGARLAAIEAIRCGTTTLNSMYWHPDGEIAAFRDIGVRLMAGPPIISGMNSISLFEYLIDDYHGTENDLIRIALNPHAPYTVTPNEYKEIQQYKNSYNEQTNGPPLMVHTHIAEERNEMDKIREFSSNNDFSIPTTIETPVQYFNHHGLLDDDLIAAHAVETTSKDKHLLKTNDVGIVLNTVSNMKLGNNVPNLEEYTNVTSKIALGTDGPASNNGIDMFEAIKIASLREKNLHNDPSKGAATRMLRIATKQAADVLGWNTIGSIQAGKRADIIALDINQPHLRPISGADSSIHSLLVYSAQGNDVSDVMINGIWRMRDNNLIEIDLEDELLNFEMAVEELRNSLD